MATRRQFVLAGAGAAVAAGAAVLFPGLVPGAARAADGAPAQRFPFTLTDAQWRARLTPAQYKILRQEGTEPPYSSPLNDEHRAGIFSCAGCGNRLYSSRTKFESHTGWPSFWKPLDGAIGTHEDRTFGMLRTEVHCARCGGHLGHVFDDGPKPTGLRYCMDGLALSFKPGAA
ncbi:peptide-methionine (R)-S-oxide reductase MsrB [Candidimonas nitroreducens]|uniref:peptide-methionine (R)-S-oxide reductase n=1 Tax=Candidimonas nitroreducens TaxID=683354 RepID=A0A225M3R7_9BURK|nr:peptide-methionine (R)-S-oxide reductase MsrB [Candidimonas nitroreducens]OWT53599.1 peptide-methionine (R)-S-oxide reductase [Candidimonas nitroreducens]